MALYNVIGVGEKDKYSDEQSYYDVINYILNHAIYAGCASIHSLKTASQEMLETAVRFGKNSRKRLRHSVLSFADREIVSPAMADLFAQQIIQYYAPDYQIVYAVHINQENLHIHFVMNQVSYVNGARYRGQHDDYNAFCRHIQAITHLPVIS